MNLSNYQAAPSKFPGGKKRWTVLAALAGAACVAVGLIGFESAKQDTVTYHQKALEAYHQTLSDHHEFAVSQGQKVQNLMDDGLNNMKGTLSAVQQLSEAVTNNQSFESTGAPALQGGSLQLAMNVNWGAKATDGTVDTEKLKASFADTLEFNNEIAQMFPQSYNLITKLRQDLKIHHFDLGNIIQDVEILAESTKYNVRRAVRKLELREKYEESGRLTPTIDAKIWKYEIKSQISDLAYSQEKCDGIVQVLHKLQEDCSKTQDYIEAELGIIKEKLKADIRKNESLVKTYEEKAKDSKCGVWDAIFTLGISCIIQGIKRDQFNAIKAKYATQLKLVDRLESKMHYFDGLIDTAKLLNIESSGLLEQTKKFSNDLNFTKEELEQDFTDEEIEDNLFDEAFATEFAETLWQSFNDLTQSCDRVITDSQDRKQRLTDALIWG